MKRAVTLSVNYWLRTLFAGLVLAVALWFTLPILARRVGWEEARHETNYILHGLYALGAAAVVLFLLFLLVAPGAMYWEQRDRADRSDPTEQHKRAYAILRWLSDQADSLSDRIALEALKQYALRFVREAFGRTFAGKLASHEIYTGCIKFVGSGRPYDLPCVWASIDEIAESIDSNTEFVVDFDLSQWGELESGFHHMWKEHLARWAERITEQATPNGADIDGRRRDAAKQWRESVVVFCDRVASDIDVPELPEDESSDASRAFADNLLNLVQGVRS